MNIFDKTITIILLDKYEHYRLMVLTGSLTRKAGTCFRVRCTTVGYANNAITMQPQRRCGCQSMVITVDVMSSVLCDRLDTYTRISCTDTWFRISCTETWFRISCTDTWFRISCTDTWFWIFVHAFVLIRHTWISATCCRLTVHTAARSRYCAKMWVTWHDVQYVHGRWYDVQIGRVWVRFPRFW